MTTSVGTATDGTLLKYHDAEIRQWNLQLRATQQGFPQPRLRRFQYWCQPGSHWFAHRHVCGKMDAPLGDENKYALL
eukprot:2741127-Amphidinium_carterae.1